MYSRLFPLVSILVLYDSRFGSTEKMAKAIADGAMSEGAKVKLKKLDSPTKSELSKYDVILLGSPTNYGTLTTKMREFMDTLEKDDLKGKVGSAFGSYGWSGGAVEMLISAMRAFEMEVIEPGLARVPVDSFLLIGDCKNFGSRIAKEAKARLQSEK
jgi:flavorubredoxin